MKKQRGIFFIAGLLLTSLLSGSMSYAEDDYARLNKESTATFSISEQTTDPEIGTLVLKQVPSFNFGTIDEEKIYLGFSNQKSLNDGTIIIRDTRLGNTTWFLEASMGQFSNNNVNLNGMALSINSKGSLGENLSGVIKDDNAPVSLAQSNGSHGTNEFLITMDNALLSAAANPKLNLLSDRNTFSTVINWILSPQKPSVPVSP